MDTSFLLPVEEVLQRFHVDEHHGLSDPQVQTATEKYGRNGTVHRLGAKSQKIRANPSGMQLYQKILQLPFGSSFLNNSKIS